MRSLRRYAMALFCAIPLALLAAACVKQKAVVCSYNVNSNVCNTGEGSLTGPTGVTPPTTTTPGVSIQPGPFRLISATCSADRRTATLRWERSANAEHYEFDQQTFTDPKNRIHLSTRVAGDVTTVDLPAAAGTNFWSVVAINGSLGTRWTIPPEVRTDVPEFAFACGSPQEVAAPAPNPNPNPGPGPSPGPDGSTPTPPAGNVCTGSGAFSPFGATGRQGTSITVTITGGCSQRLTTSAPDNVRLVNNGSTATITFRSPGEDSKVCNGQGACATFRTIP